MWRSVLGIIVGIVVWMAVFTALAMLLGLLWPAFAEQGRIWFEQKLFTLSPPMAVCGLIFWAVAAVAAGWVGMLIARRSGAVWLMALLMWGYAMSIHIVLDWSRFPWWYNLGVVIPLLPAVWLGSRWGSRNSSAVRRAQPA